MRHVILKLISIAVLSIWVAGCNNASNAEVGTVVGAGTGALVGYAVAPNNAVGAVVGAGAGALVGHHIGKQQDIRQYRHYHHNHYHHYHHHHGY